MPHDAPPPRKPSQSGADTPRSTDLIRHGGKVDPAALRRKIVPDSGPTDSAAEEGATPADLIPADPDRAPPEVAGGVDDDAPNRVVFVLQRDLQKRLDRYLTDRIPFMSRTQLQRLIDEGGVTINGRTPKASTRVGADDRIEVFIPPPPPSEVQPEDIPLQVLYEDEHIIVLNKSPDIIVHPARAHNKGTLINALAYHFAHRSPAGGALSEVGKEFARPGVVHRLDRQTSGLIVFAKDDTAHWRLARQFELRTVDKRYLALVHGLVEPPIEVIDLPLGPHPSREKGYREKYVVRHDALGKPSVTICRVRAHFGGKPALPAGLPEAPVPEVLKRPGWAMPGESLRTASAGSAGSESRHTYSLVELELKTGRTHQIRVHLSHNGYPIVGDDMYGGRPLMRADLDPAAAGDPEEPPLIARQALHAALLAFRHPITNAPMAFTAPLPPDFSNALSALVAADPAARRLDPPGSSVNLGTMLPG